MILTTIRTDMDQFRLPDPSPQCQIEWIHQKENPLAWRVDPPILITGLLIAQGF